MDNFCRVIYVLILMFISLLVNIRDGTQLLSMSTYAYFAWSPQKDLPKRLLRWLKHVQTQVL